MVDSFFIDDSPTWESVTTAPSAALRWLEKSPIPASVLRMRLEGEHTPFVALMARPGVFRKPINQSTPARVFVDVITALPFPTPFAYVVPVLFDDEEDPYWAPLVLSLFPRSDGWGGPQFRAAAAENTRDIVACFARTGRCGFVVIDDMGGVLKAELIEFDQAMCDRLQEILEVLDYIRVSGHERTQAESEAPQEVFQQVFCFLVERQEGRGLVVPPGRSLLEAKAMLTPVMVDHGRLIDRAAVHDRAREPAPDIDLFLSHAHADGAAVHRLSQWVSALWPDLTIEHTDSDDEERFRDEPAYFFTLARRSRCLLYVATPSSVSRPMVDTEIGCCADKPIVSLCLGGVDPSDLRRKVDESLFLALDSNRVVDAREDGAWVKLAGLLAEALGRIAPDRIDPPDLAPLGATHKRPGTGAYLSDWLTIATSTYGIRDESEAQSVIINQLVADAAKGGGDPDRIRSLLERVPVRLNLLTLLVGRPEKAWPSVLDLFSPLLDMKLLTNLRVFLRDLETHRGVRPRPGLQRAVEVHVLKRALGRLQPWALVRGETHHFDLGIHPKALELFDHVEIRDEPQETFDFGFHEPEGAPPFQEIRRHVPAGGSAKEWFVGKLCERIKATAEQSPHTRVIYSTTDLHTDRAAGLLGGDWIETREETPMRGMRGLLRYLQPGYRELLAWEWEACARARASVHELAVVFPLPRRPEELRQGIKSLRAARLDVSAVGMIPEAPTTFMDIRSFLSAGATCPRLLILLELGALRSGFGLAENGHLSHPETETLWRALETLVGEARQGAELMNLSVELAISLVDAETLRELDAVKALAVVERMSILVDAETTA